MPSSTASITARAARCTCQRPALRQSGPGHLPVRRAREAQFRIRDDFNGAEQEGARHLPGDAARTASAGARRAAYLHPHMGKRPNLRVETQAHATRILLRRQARGRRRIHAGQGDEAVLRARREVILAAGAFQSPQLLMLSGVGDGAALAQARHRERASICRASAEICRIIRISCSASPPTSRTSSGLSLQRHRPHPQGHRRSTGASGAGR